MAREASLRVKIDSQEAVSNLLAVNRGMGLVVTAGIAMAGVLSVQVVRSLVAVSQELVRAGSAATEIQSKFDVVFGQSAPRARRELDLIAQSAGRSRIELEKSAAEIQDVLVPSGFDRSIAANLSTDLARLAVDVGSFNNRADADVLQRFTSAIVGNSEAVRVLGIDTKELAVQQEAYRLGIADTGLELTEQQKRLARISLLFSQSSDAIGDAERTADSYENTMRRVSGTVADLQADLGQGLAQSVADLINTGPAFAVGMGLYETALEKIATTGQRASFALQTAGRAALLAILPEGTAGTFEAITGALERVERLQSAVDAASVGSSVEEAVRGTPSSRLEQRAQQFEARRDELRALLGQSRAERIGAALGGRDEPIEGRAARGRAARAEIESLEEALRSEAEQIKRNEIEQRRLNAARQEATEFAQGNRLALTALDSGMAGFANTIAGAAAGFGSLKDLGRAALQGLLYDLTRVTAEALFFQTVVGPALNGAGVSRGAQFNLFGAVANGVGGLFSGGGGNPIPATSGGAPSPGAGLVPSPSTQNFTFNTIQNGVTVGGVDPSLGLSARQAGLSVQRALGT